MWWRSKTSIKTEGMKVHVKYDTLNLNSGHKEQATDAVVMAREFMQVAIRCMANRDTMDARAKALAAYYFKTSPQGPTQVEFNLIKSTLELIHNGINANISVKFVNKEHVAGYINPYKHWGAKSHHTKVTNQMTGKTRKRGDIHLGINALRQEGGIAAMVFIHEASHKFAGTADFGERGYTWVEDGTFRDEGLTKVEAFNNAESYGRFVMHLAYGGGPV